LSRKTGGKMREKSVEKVWKTKAWKELKKFRWKKFGKNWCWKNVEMTWRGESVENFRGKLLHM